MKAVFVGLRIYLIENIYISDRALLADFRNNIVIFFYQRIIPASVLVPCNGIGALFINRCESKPDYLIRKVFSYINELSDIASEPVFLGNQLTADNLRIINSCSDNYYVICIIQNASCTFSVHTLKYLIGALSRYSHIKHMATRNGVVMRQGELYAVYPTAHLEIPLSVCNAVTED